VFFNAENFFEMFVQIRDVFITGRKGSGKTLLAFAMADYALQNRFVSGVFANIPHRFPVAQSVANAFVIVDESWQFIDNRFSKSTYSFMGAWSRKTGSLWAFPSVYGVDLRVRNLQVERVADINLLPVRVWIYRWESVWGDKGHFALIRPERYYGTYDTRAIPVDDGGAVASLMSLVPESIKLVHRGRQGGEDYPVVSSVDIRSLEARVSELERRVSWLYEFSATGAPERLNS